MKRLLLVEDDRSLGATLCERLQREKYDVYWAETKQRALKKLGEGFWDLVILDIGLPDGSGFELARHIKEKTSLPIMFMTALSTAEHRLEGFEIGAADFIPKPFHLRELLLRVKHVLDRHPVQREISCNGRVIELTNRVIVQPGGEREHPAAREFSECAGSTFTIYAADLADAPGGPLSQTLPGAAREIFIHGFVQTT